MRYSPDDCLHLWLATEEYIPTIDPIWTWVCRHCHSIGEGRESEVIDNIRLATSDEWRRLYDGLMAWCVRRTEPDLPKA